MKNIQHLAIALAILLSCTSCFEIVEQVSLKENGSGSFKLTTNLSQSKRSLDGIFSKDSLFGKPIPKISVMEAKMEEAKRALSSQQGISKVVLTKDFTNYLFVLSCEFTSVEALDNALAATVEHFDEKGRSVPRGNYSFNGTTFERKVVYDYVAEVGRNMTGKARDVLAQAKFRAIYRFPKEISEVSNPKAKVSPSRKTTMLATDLLSIATSQQAIANKIELK